MFKILIFSGGDLSKMYHISVPCFSKDSKKQQIGDQKIRVLAVEAFY